MCEEHGSVRVCIKLLASPCEYVKKLKSRSTESRCFDDGIQSTLGQIPAMYRNRNTYLLIKMHHDVVTFPYMIEHKTMLFEYLDDLLWSSRGKSGHI